MPSLGGDLFASPWINLAEMDGTSPHSKAIRVMRVGVGITDTCDRLRSDQSRTFKLSTSLVYLCTGGVLSAVDGLIVSSNT